VGIGQETAVHHQIGIHRKTVFETEGDHVGPWARLVALTEETDDSGLELVHVQLGGVDDQVGLAPDRKQGLSFASDPVGDASVTLQWVWSAHPDRNSTRLNSSHVSISYAVFCLNYLYM